MNPVELIHTVLCMNATDMWPDWKQPGGPVVVQVEAAAISKRIIDAFASQGMVIVSADDQQALLGLLKELADPEPCWFDHDGGCQAHGPTSTWPRCPHAHAREMLAALPEETTADGR